MRSIAAKFVLPLAILGLLYAGFLHYRSYTMSRQHVHEMTDRQAAIALEFNLAVREYVAEQVRPIVAGMIGKEDFIPEAMSTSFVSRNVFEKVRKKFPEIIIKFSSDNPRNPVNAASPDELKIIRYFNAHPGVNKYATPIRANGKEYLAYFSAKRMETACLRCHGRPEDAPAALIKRYGSTASFHRPLGKVVAMDTVAVPMDEVNARLSSEMAQQSVIAVGGLVLLLGGIWAVFRLTVSRRLAKMSAHFRKIAGAPEGSEITPIAVAGSDEIAGLAGSFNTLAERQQASYASLEERVAARTRELAQANEELKREVAERQRAEEQLHKAKTAAESASYAKSEFLANMSHELRTPLTAILGFADILTEEEGARGASAGTLDGLRIIKSNGEHLLTLINDILDLSKIEAGRMAVEKIGVSPRHLIEEVVALIGVRASAKGLKLVVEQDGPVPDVIQTDPTRLRQVLLNIVGNAIKFTETGGVRLVYRLSGTSAPQMQFDIIDTGIGMSSEQAARLFQPFSQADASTTRRFGGTGLGLTVSRRLAQMLDGEVSIVRSEPNAGSWFRVTIATGSLDGISLVGPIVKPAPRPVSPIPSGNADAHAAPALRHRRILIAEDGPENQLLISRLLSKAGAEVVAVDNGAEAVEGVIEAAAKGTPFDLVVMDMQMPVLNGYEATRLLRHKGYRGPVLALTASAMDGDREECCRAGCDDYITKPVNRKLLIDSALRCIENRTAECVAGRS